MFTCTSCDRRCAQLNSKTVMGCPIYEHMHEEFDLEGYKCWVWEHRKKDPARDFYDFTPEETAVAKEKLIIALDKVINFDFGEIKFPCHAARPRHFAVLVEIDNSIRQGRYFDACDMLDELVSLGYAYSPGVRANLADMRYQYFGKDDCNESG